VIDNFALLLSHMLLAIAFWRLLERADLDNESSGSREIQTHSSDEKSSGFAGDRVKHKNNGTSSGA
jgi:hypothetical protein